MDSSTSNSNGERGASGLLNALQLTIRHFGAPALIAAAILCVGEIAYRRAPIHPRSDPDEVAVSAQIYRAQRLPDSAVLVIGDSSSGANVDADELGRLLGGKHVECLSVQGWVGPAGYAHMLDEYFAKERPPTTVILLLHGDPLRMKTEEFARFGTERRVLEGVPRPLRRPGAGARVKFFEDLINPLIDLPLPGLLGAQYGWPDDLSRAIKRQNGCLPDPNSFEAKEKGAYEFSLSPAVADRLELLRSSLERSGAASVRFGMSPIPSSLAGPGTIESRDAVREEIRTALRLERDALLDTPLKLPDENFASVTHLNLSGRSSYTPRLFELLESH